MSADPGTLAGLDDLAHELDRWAAYASGTIDDARVRLRHVREHARRAERSVALAERTIERDGSDLADLTLQLSRLSAECEHLGFELTQRTTLNAQLVEEGTELLHEIEVVLRDNLRRQEAAASAVSTNTRHEERARARLHRALENQRVAFHRRFRRSGQAGAEREVLEAEAEARRTSEVLATARNHFASLRLTHERLVTEAAALEDELAGATVVGTQLRNAAQALDEVRQAIAEARAAQQVAITAQSRAEAVARVMREHTDAATTALLEAAQWERDAVGTYDDVQQLTSDVAIAVRERITGLADTRRLQHDPAGSGTRESA